MPAFEGLDPMPVRVDVVDDVVVVADELVSEGVVLPFVMGDREDEVVEIPRVRSTAVVENGLVRPSVVVMGRVRPAVVVTGRVRSSVEVRGLVRSCVVVVEPCQRVSCGVLRRSVCVKRPSVVVSSVTGKVGG